MIAGSRIHTLLRPAQCAAWLSSGDVVRGARVVVLRTAEEMVLFEVVFAPPFGCGLIRFPVERTMVLVAGEDVPAAVPLGPTRKWLHRYPRIKLDRVSLNEDWPVALASLVGGLCLWYPEDPETLRWTWGKGFDDYIRILQRHLWYEESWRRAGIWPVEDAPHGWGLDGRPHPIVSEDLRMAS